VEITKRNREPKRLHELAIAFQGSVQFGAVDDHAGLLVVAHLLEGERASDHITGKALPAFEIVGFVAAVNSELAYTADMMSHLREFRIRAQELQGVLKSAL